MPHYFLIVLHLAVALGLVNVWIVRNKNSTQYRGGESKNLKEEFKEYGLPDWAYYFVGALKLGSALLLIIGLGFSQVVPFAAATVSLLMVGALCMHIKVSDPLKKSVPAVTMFLMSSVIFLSYSNII